jgi:hypothetical protein
MRIGIDFDNTIICYDTVFHAAATEKGLIPEDLPLSKNRVRDYLREIGEEDAWTELQGYIYGTRMSDAKLFPGVSDFFLFCYKNRIPIFIISHKTRYAYRGPGHDLHHATFQWLERQNFFSPDGFGLSIDNIFLELTREEKIKRIIQLKCTHFIDDLPEFLSEPSFPSGVKRILFDPNGNHFFQHEILHFFTWEMIKKYFTEPPT